MNETLLQQLKYLEDYRLDALVAMTGESFRYTIGTQAPSQSTVRTRHAIGYTTRLHTQRAVVVDIDREYVQNNSWLSPSQIISYNEFVQKPVALLAECLQREMPDIKRLAIEMDFLPACDYILLKKMMPRVEIVDATPLFMQMREIKTAGELELIEAFARSAESVIDYTFRQFRLGMSEYNIGEILANGFHRIGGDKLTMTTVASGEKSCMLNSEPGDRIIQSGDVVRVDLIGIKNGYYCDICRTFVAGQAQESHHNIWRNLVDIHDSIVAQLKPGASTLAIYQNYAQALKAQGYTPINFVAHGVGLSLHEQPYIYQYKDIELKEKMALCIEPICIVPGKYGFQLENALTITKDGCRLLTGTSGAYKTLPVLGGGL